MLIPILATMRRRPPRAELGNAQRCNEGAAEPQPNEGDADVLENDGAANRGGCAPGTR